MAGRALFTEDDSHPIQRCYLLNDVDEWEDAKNPLNKYSTIRKELSMQKLNPGYTFAKAMLKQDDSITIGLIVNARGGTKIEQWGKDTLFYVEALRRVRAAQKSGTLKGILWHQGEGNAKNPITYLNDLKVLVSNIRTDLGDLNLPFIAGQVYYHPVEKPHTKKLNEEIKKLSSELPFVGYVSSGTLTTHDNTHFDTKGMKLLGKRYAIEMRKVQALIKTPQKDAE